MSVWMRVKQQRQKRKTNTISKHLGIYNLKWHLKIDQVANLYAKTNVVGCKQASDPQSLSAMIVHFCKLVNPNVVIFQCYRHASSYMYIVHCTSLC